MKKFFQILGVCSILVFSFYYTDKIALLVEQKNPVLQEIKNKKESLKVKSVNATIVDDSIIPGISGSVVNVEKSFQKMKSLNAYNEYYLVYDEVKPVISLNDNKDKIIVSGNKSKNQVSLIIANNPDLINYFSGYKVNLLVNKDNYFKTSKYELINNETNKKLFNQVNTLLDKDNLNKNLCILNDYNKKLCLENDNYLVKPSLKLTHSSIIKVKNSLENGSIILIDKSAKKEDIAILLKQIEFQDLEIVYLSQLLKE